MKNYKESSNKISMRATIAGAMISFCFMFLALSLLSSLGIWDHKIHTLASASTAFWILASLSWMLSLYFAGFIAALSSHAKSNTAGALNALVACCGSSIVLIVALAFFAPKSIIQLLNFANLSFFRNIFWGNLLAFSTGVYGGVAAVHFKQRTVETFKSERSLA